VRLQISAARQPRAETGKRLKAGASARAAVARAWWSVAAIWPDGWCCDIRYHESANGQGKEPRVPDARARGGETPCPTRALSALSQAGHAVTGKSWQRCSETRASSQPPEHALLAALDLIWTSIDDKFSGSIKITTHLDHVSHCNNIWYKLVE